MAQRWRDLTDEEKVRYEDMAAKDRQRFYDEVNEYLRKQDLQPKTQHREVFKIEKVEKK